MQRPASLCSSSRSEALADRAPRHDYARCPTSPTPRAPRRALSRQSSVFSDLYAVVFRKSRAGSQYSHVGLVDDDADDDDDADADGDVRGGGARGAHVERGARDVRPRKRKSERALNRCAWPSDHSEPRTQRFAIYFICSNLPRK